MDNPEYRLVEKPLMQGLRSIGHQVNNQFYCKAGYIDLYDTTDKEIIECKARGDINHLTAAHSQLLKYKVALNEINHIAIAVPRIEEKAEDFARALFENGIRVIQTDNFLIQMCKCVSCKNVRFILNDEDYFKFLGDKWSRKTRSGINWYQYILELFKNHKFNEAQISEIKENDHFRRITKFSKIEPLKSLDFFTYERIKTQEILDEAIVIKMYLGQDKWDELLKKAL